MATKKEIHALLDKAIGKKGPLRIPAYWMREVLSKMIEWAEGLTPKVDVPTKMSELENDVPLATQSYVNAKATEAGKTIYCGKISSTSLLYLTGVTQYGKTIQPSVNSDFYIYNNAFYCDNLVPNTNNVGSIGTSVKKYNSVYATNVVANSLTGSLPYDSITNKPTKLSEFENDLDLTSYIDDSVSSAKTYASNVVNNAIDEIKPYKTIIIRCNSSASDWYCKTDSDILQQLHEGFNLIKYKDRMIFTPDVSYSSSQFITEVDFSISEQTIGSANSVLTHFVGGNIKLPKVYDDVTQFNINPNNNLLSLDLSEVRLFNISSNLNNVVFGSEEHIENLILGKYFFACKNEGITIDLSDAYFWTNDTVITSLVDNIYDRTKWGLNTLTIKLSAPTKAVLSEEQITVIEAKGYSIVN